MGRQFLLSEPPVDGRAKIDGGEFHHLVHVLRARVGDEITVFDGGGGRFRAALESLAHEAASVRILEPLASTGSTMSVQIASSTPKGGRVDVLVEKLAELGVVSWQPLLMERTPPSGRPGPGRLERWKRLAEAASKQCGRADLLTIAEPRPLEDVLESTSSEGRIFGCLDTSSSSLIERIRERPRCQDWSIVIGPEGGASAAEEGRLVEAGFRAARWAGHVLRVETAAIAAASVLAAMGEESRR